MLVFTQCWVDRSIPLSPAERMSSCCTQYCDRQPSACSSSSFATAPTQIESTHDGALSRGRCAGDGHDDVHGRGAAGGGGRLAVRDVHAVPAAHGGHRGPVLPGRPAAARPHPGPALQLHQVRCWSLKFASTHELLVCKQEREIRLWCACDWMPMQGDADGYVNSQGVASMCLSDLLLVTSSCCAKPPDQITDCCTHSDSAAWAGGRTRAWRRSVSRPW